MAEEVRVDFLRESGLFGSLFDDLSDAVRGKRAAANGEKNMGGSLSGFDEFWALADQVVSNGFEGSFSHGDEAGLVAFASHSQDGVIFVEMLQSSVAKLGEPQTGGVE